MKIIIAFSDSKPVLASLPGFFVFHVMDAVDKKEEDVATTPPQDGDTVRAMPEAVQWVDPLATSFGSPYDPTGKFASSPWELDHYIRGEVNATTGAFQLKFTPPTPIVDSSKIMSVTKIDPANYCTDEQRRDAPAQ